MVRLVVIVPAAGHSRRMGQPKLLLPLGDRPVIAWLVEAFDHPSVLDVLVVVRPDDTVLAEAAAAAGAVVVRAPEPPPDMKASVGWGIDEMRKRGGAGEIDGWMLVPADHPVLDADLVGRVAEAWSVNRPPVLVPTHDGRRGHPTVFGVELASEVASIPDDSGLNWLVAQCGEAVEEVELDRPEVLLDLDTPEQYEALRRRMDEQEG